MDNRVEYSNLQYWSKWVAIFVVKPLDSPKKYISNVKQKILNRANVNNINNNNNNNNNNFIETRLQDTIGK